MDTFVVLQQMLILLAMMAIGYYSYRKEWIDRNAYGKLSKIVVNILNPLIIINGVLGRSGGENGEKVFINLLLIFLYFIILIAVSFLFALLRVEWWVTGVLCLLWVLQYLLGIAFMRYYEKRL